MGFQRKVMFSRLFVAVLLWLVIGFGGVALGLTLNEAKHRGLVGEQPNGYLGIVASSQVPDIQALVHDINLQRLEKYQEIAGRNKTTLQAVEILAGKTAISKTQPGHYIQLPSGSWAKK